MRKSNALSQNPWFWPVIGFTALIGILAVVILTVVFLMGGIGPANGPLPDTGSTTTDTPEPIVATPTPAPGSIQGLIWHDVCVSGAVGDPAPGALPLGCAQTSQGAALQANGVLESGEPGIAGVVVQLGQGACPAFGFASAVSGADGVYRFEDLAPGPYCLSIDAGAGNNPALLSSGVWTRPSEANGGALAAFNLQIASGEEKRDLNFGWDYANLPQPEPTPAATITPIANDCSDQVSFVADITIADYTNIQPGGSFEKIWRLKNSGTCTWTTDYDLVFVDGNSLNGATAIPLAKNVAPGASIDLEVDLKAPANNGVYRGEWMLRNAAGERFGMGQRADQPFWVTIVVGPSGSTVQGFWKGEYFNNQTLKGSPAARRDDVVIDFSWKRDRPISGVDSDNFSVRWTGAATFQAGSYRFTGLVDDGLRVYVDGALVLDAWTDGAVREVTADVGLSQGLHQIRVEYYENRGEARARLRWEKISSPKFSDWKGEYFSTRDLSGNPVLVRNDGSIDFDWEDESPVTTLDENNYSVRWTRTVNFEAGTYRLMAQADDGIRVYLDGERVINEWHDSSGDPIYQVERQLSGKVKVKVEYYERSGNARVHVWWEKLTPTQTPTATATPTASPTATETEPTVPTETEPAPGETPSPTATATEPGPAPEIRYNFAEQACQAQWSNAAGMLPCPGAAADPQGYVMSMQDPDLESAQESPGLGLLTYPQAVENGSIRGIYPPFQVQSGDRLRVTLGCLQGHPNCDLTFQIDTWSDGEPITRLASWEEHSDGQTTEVNLDLTALSGQEVIFIFSVAAGESASDDAGIWFQPRIVR